MKRLSLLFLASCLTACADEDKSEPKVPATPGYSAYIQANLSANGQNATIGARVYKDGRKITLVAGDAIRVRNGGNETLLEGTTKRFGFYAGNLAVEDTSLGVDFEIVHESVETRDDRWYPADIAYVDPGPGQFVGLAWSIDFPLPITITLPSDEPRPDIYKYADDTVIIQWSSASADIDNVRVKAYLECLNKTAEIYFGPDTGEASVTIADIFYEASYSPITEVEEFVRDIFQLIIDPEDILSYNPIDEHFIHYCEIDLYVLAEYENLIGPPFVEGNVVASQSDKTTIIFNPFTPLEL